MTISLSPQYEAFINDQVSSGRFASPEAVVEASLKILEQETKRTAHLKQMVDEALAEDVWYSAEEVFAYLEAELEKLPE